jgi:Zn finger protein HypA/HybF involved in hydrogenase expression
MKVHLGKKLECLRCGKTWFPRKEDVRICPECKSAYWDTAKQDET